jgi:lysophospholipase L1-like esterase
VALVLGGLAGEVWCRAALRARMAAAESFRHQHPNVLDARLALVVWGDPVWAWRWESYKPLAHVVRGVGDQQIRVDINSLGFRTREFSPQKPAGRIRVVCIGGSTTVQGQTNETTYPALLERSLRARHPERDLEVLNLGISRVDSGYWPRRSFRFLEFEPDVVVQYEGVNDLLNEHLPAWAARHPFESRLRRSLLLEWLFPLRSHALDPALGQTVRNIAAISAACRARGVRHVVGTFAAPDAARASSEMRAFLDVNLVDVTGGANGPFRLSRYRTYQELLDRLNRIVKDAAAPAGFQVSPVADRLRDPESFVDICHMTPDGIGALAEAFRPEVESALR